MTAVLGCNNAARRNGGGGGAGGTDGGGGTIEDLVVTPADAAIDVDATTLPTIDYQVHDQSGKDVTADCTLIVEDLLLGSFSGATFHPTGTAGGITQVRATRGADFGKTSLTVRLKKVVIAPGAPADAPGKFGGPATGAAPTMVYPPDGTLVPPNLNELEVQFTPPAGATLFEVGFVGPALDLK
ncbi:MAG TPA: hypothetical protein VF997_23510, partial [Polyangia bacterium]